MSYQPRKFADGIHITYTTLGRFELEQMVSVMRLVPGSFWILIICTFLTGIRYGIDCSCAMYPTNNWSFSWYLV